MPHKPEGIDVLQGTRLTLNKQRGASNLGVSDLGGDDRISTKWANPHVRDGILSVDRKISYTVTTIFQLVVNV